MGMIKNIRIHSAVIDITIDTRKAIKREYDSLFNNRYTVQFIVSCIESMFSLHHAKMIGAVLPPCVEGQTEEERLNSLLKELCFKHVAYKGLLPLNEEEKGKFNKSLDAEFEEFIKMCK